MAGRTRSHPYRVFVYGSLRRGGLYHAIMGDAQLLWMGRTEPSFELVDLGAYPGATEGGTTAIYGELYAIREGVLRELDVLEEVPDVYQRKCTSIDGHRAFIYLLRPEHARGRPRIASGVWPIHRRG